MSEAQDKHNDSADRLSFTLFVALAVHALIVFGCTFTIDKSSNVAPTLNITLATHKAQDEPDKADFLAQHNQLASGTEQTAKELTTNQQADIADSRIHEINPTPQQKKITANEQQRKIVDTIKNDARKILDTTDVSNDEKLDPREGQEVDASVMSEKAASLKAKVDQQKQEYAKIPRIIRMTSVASKASEDAQYLLSWTQKIEQIGDKHFPREAIDKGIEGELQLMVRLLPNGRIDDVEILRSSGYSLLDDAALQIVRLSAPFAPFPKKMYSNYDKLEIIRTWRFKPSGLTTH